MESVSALLDILLDGALYVVPSSDISEEQTDFEIFAANSAARRMLEGGLDASIVGGRCAALFPGLRESGVLDTYQRVLESGTPERFDIEYAQDTIESWFRVTVSPHGRGLIVVFADIGDLVGARRRAEQHCTDLIEANDQLTSQASELAALAEGIESARQETAEEVRRRRLLEGQLRQLAETDYLTGLANRRSFMESARHAFDKADDSGNPMGVILMDIDHFKAINDQFGHAAGDLALLSISEFLASTPYSDSDRVCRFGGEEFALVLNNKGSEAIWKVAERLRQGISELQISLAPHRITLTASFGCAILSPGDRSIDDLIMRADKALYRAKAKGRNRVEPETEEAAREMDGAARSTG
ncbi:MAG: diguanylate cyclase [Pseudomonadota bacterium]